MVRADIKLDSTTGGMKFVALKGHLKTLLRQEGFEENFKIVDYFCTTSLTRVRTVDKEYKEQIKRIEKVNEMINSGDFDKEEIDQLEKLLRKQDNLKNKLNKKRLKLWPNLKQVPLPPVPSRIALRNRKIHQFSVGFVTFSDPLVAKRLVKLARIMKKKTYLKCQCRKPATSLYWAVEITKAPKLDRVIWKNAIYSREARSGLRFTIHGVCLCVNWILHHLIIWMQGALFQFAVDKPPGLAKSAIFYIVLTTGVELIFKIGSLVYKQLGKLSINIEKDGFDLVSMLMLSGVKTLAFYFSYNKLRVVDELIEETLYQKIFGFMLIDIVLQGVVKVVGISNTIKYIKFWFLLVKGKFSNGKILMFQNDLNVAFEKPECAIGYLCCFKLHVVFIATYFTQKEGCFAVPFIGYLLVSIPVDRWILLRFYAEPNRKDVRIFENLIGVICGFSINLSFLFSLYSWDDEYSGLGKEFDQLQNRYIILFVVTFILVFLHRPLFSVIFLYLKARMDVVDHRSSGEKRVSSFASAGDDDEILSQNDLKGDEIGVEEIGFRRKYGDIFT